MEEGEEHPTFDVFESAAAKLLELPSAPAFMCIMRTIEGQPVGFPVWKTFENRPNELSLSNETLSSTFLSLSKNLKTLNPNYSDEKETIMRISFNQRSWSIFVPGSESEFQISFFVAFEEKDSVDISDEDRVNLTNQIVEKLRKHPEIQAISSGEVVRETINPNDELYREILEIVSKTIQTWDKKRIRYLKEEAEKERQRIIAEAQAKANEETD